MLDGFNGCQLHTFGPLFLCFGAHEIWPGVATVEVRSIDRAAATATSSSSSIAAALSNAASAIAALNLRAGSYKTWEFKESGVISRRAI